MALFQLLDINIIDKTYWLTIHSPKRSISGRSIEVGVALLNRSLSSNRQITLCAVSGLISKCDKGFKILHLPMDVALPKQVACWGMMRSSGVIFPVFMNAPTYHFQIDKVLHKTKTCYQVNLINDLFERVVKVAAIRLSSRVVKSVKTQQKQTQKQQMKQFKGQTSGACSNTAFNWEDSVDGEMEAQTAGGNLGAPLVGLSGMRSLGLNNVNLRKLTRYISNNMFSELLAAMVNGIQIKAECQLPFYIKDSFTPFVSLLEDDDWKKLFDDVSPFLSAIKLGSTIHTHIIAVVSSDKNENMFTTFLSPSARSRMIDVYKNLGSSDETGAVTTEKLNKSYISLISFLSKYKIIKGRLTEPQSDNQELKKKGNRSNQATMISEAGVPSEPKRGNQTQLSKNDIQAIASAIAAHTKPMPKRQSAGRGNNRGRGSGQSTKIS